jgi:hypothetical protein
VGKPPISLSRLAVGRAEIRQFAQRSIKPAIEKLTRTATGQSHSRRAPLMLSWSPERASAGSQRLWLDRYATVAISCSVRCRPGGLRADVDLVVVQSLSHSHRPFRRGDRDQQRLGRPTLTQIATSASRRLEQANAVPEADPPAAPDLGVRDQSGLYRTAFCQLCAEVAQLPALEPGVVPGSCDAGEGTERPVKHSRDQGVDEFQFPCIVQL